MPGNVAAMAMLNKRSSIKITRSVADAKRNRETKETLLEDDEDDDVPVLLLSSAALPDSTSALSFDMVIGHFQFIHELVGYK